MSNSRVSDSKANGEKVRRLRAWLCCLLAAAVVLGGCALSAQTPEAPPAASAKVKKPSPRHARKTAQVEAAPEPAPAPPEPEVPHWPVNENPGQPAVTWDAQGLKIAATNSSLKQIMNDVANATGAKVEGLGQDQRVFGDFGPGQARDVLSQLLVGSGYNVLMIGDQGEGTPRQIVLSARHSGKTAGTENQPQPQQDMQQDDEQPEQPEQEEPFPQPQINNRPPIIQPPGGPPEGARTPQQVLQELQQRQQQMQDQQQIAPQQQPPGPPQD
jgi:hypothetical protein